MYTPITAARISQLLSMFKLPTAAAEVVARAPFDSFVVRTARRI